MSPNTALPKIGQEIIFQSPYPNRRNGEKARILEIKSNPNSSFPQGIIFYLEFVNDSRLTYAGIDEIRY